MAVGDEEGLEDYALGKAGESKELDRWWGTLLASRGQLPEAMAAYEAAQDTLSQVLPPSPLCLWQPGPAARSV